MRTIPLVRKRPPPRRWAWIALLVLAPASVHAVDPSGLGYFQAISVAAGPEAMAMSPDGRHLYVASYSSDAITVLRRSTDTGHLVYAETIVNGAGGVQDMDGPTAIDVSADGKHVYVVSQLDDSIVVFGRDSLTGFLSYVQSRVDGVGGFDALDGARDVAVSPDGDHVYVASVNEDAVAILARNSTSGGLTYVGARRDSEATNPPLELAGANQVVVTSDGFVMVAAQDDDGLQIFSRNSSTGQLSQWQEVSLSPSSTVTGIALSPNLDKVYLSDYSRVGVLVYNRSTGGLLQGLIGYLGTEPLTTPANVAMDPDGHHFYALNYFANALYAYLRDPQTGLLRVEGYAQSGTAGVTGIGSPASVVASPDGRHVYVAGFADGKVAGFRRVVFEDDVETGDVSKWSSKKP